MLTVLCFVWSTCSKTSLWLTSVVDLPVLFQAAVLVEAPSTRLTLKRFLSGVDPLVSLQMRRSLEAFTAVRADIFKRQGLHPPPFFFERVLVRTVTKPSAARSRLNDVWSSFRRTGQSIRVSRLRFCSCFISIQFKQGVSQRLIVRTVSCGLLTSILHWFHLHHQQRHGVVLVFRWVNIFEKGSFIPVDV